MNSLKSFVTGFFLWSILGGISAQNKALSFSMPDGSGTLKLGIIENDSSQWLDEKQTQLHIDCHPLSDTKGFILEIEIREKISHWDGLLEDAMRPLQKQILNLNIAKTMFQCRRYTSYSLPRKSYATKSDQSYSSLSFFHSFIRRTQATYSVGTFHIWKENGCSRTGSNLPDS